MGDINGKLSYLNFLVVYSDFVKSTSQNFAVCWSNGHPIDIEIISASISPYYMKKH